MPKKSHRFDDFLAQRTGQPLQFWYQELEIQKQNHLSPIEWKLFLNNRGIRPLWSAVILDRYKKKYERT